MTYVKGFERLIKTASFFVALPVDSSLALVNAPYGHCLVRPKI